MRPSMVIVDGLLLFINNDYCFFVGNLIQSCFDCLLTWDQVIVTSRKQLIRGDVLIDDGIHNLEGGQYNKVLMTAPHNVHFDAEAHDMIRVHNWKEIEEVINRLCAPN